jgi:hypothetical protein
MAPASTTRRQCRPASRLTRAHREEVFGPVATLYRVVDLDAAIQLANGTEFGLGANAWTNNEEGQGRLVRHLAAGMVFINGNVTSYPQLPFGGIKNSGHGREPSIHGIREFCNIKAAAGLTVWQPLVHLARATRHCAPRKPPPCAAPTAICPPPDE